VAQRDSGEKLIFLVDFAMSDVLNFCLVGLTYKFSKVKTGLKMHAVKRAAKF